MQGSIFSCLIYEAWTFVLGFSSHIDQEEKKNETISHSLFHLSVLL